MRTEIRVSGYQLKGVSAQQAGEFKDLLLPGFSPRHLTDAWIRLMRYTFDDNDACIKQELGVLGYRDGDFEVDWREIRRGMVLTEIAPMEHYLIWMKKEES